MLSDPLFCLKIMKKYEPLSLRNDCFNCPLPLTLDSYSKWDVFHTNCNSEEGHDQCEKQIVTDPQAVYRQLLSGMKNRNPKSNLDFCLVKKKTIKFGSKGEPLQSCESNYRKSLKLIRVLNKLSWSYVIQTRHTLRLMKYEKWLRKSHELNLLTLMPIISPGLSKDWEILEGKKTTPLQERLKHCRHFMKAGMNLSVNGGAFIPGYHTIQDFVKTCRTLKAYKIKSYSTHRFHTNLSAEKHLRAIGIDTDLINRENTVENWQRILQRMLDISKKHGIVLNCSDFGNMGPKWKPQRNTCCGAQVQNPCTYNRHYWSAFIQGGKMSLDEIVKYSYDKIGNKEKGQKIIKGEQWII